MHKQFLNSWFNCKITLTTKWLEKNIHNSISQVGINVNPGGLTPNADQIQLETCIFKTSPLPVFLFHTHPLQVTQAFCYFVQFEVLQCFFRHSSAAGEAAR